ncbi:diguanylate cyclase [Psychrobium sp. MM17-31]|uniref:ligand-binding sensor domain-containing protein n=1 Tax=Psychrobium sp. MM17-31 TaxID=2917758 RepID=UPI001EF74491|nr:ligand-binding sensor domain-containing diguanylate cyclase [Psychrobium sp. MM17-31]MCG7530271.1 diguanylate cyclase [Psychrobium sp. MM17-31]
MASQRWGWHDRVFKNYTVKDGLPHGAVSAIAKDSAGFIWLWTSEGLARFDGHNFERVASPLLTANSVNAIKLCVNGKLWLGTSRGLIEFDPATRNFVQHDLLPGKVTSITDLSIGTGADSSVIWLTTNQAVFKYNTQSAALQSYELSPTGAPWRTFDLLQANDKTVWLATNQGLFYKEEAAHEFSRFDLSDELASNNRISALLQDSFGDIWIGTPANGVLIIDAEKNVSQPPIPNFNKEWIYAMTEIAPGVVWLGSYGHGIIEMVRGGAKKSGIDSSNRIESDRLNQHSILNNEIWDLYAENNGLVLVGSSLGLSLFDASQTSVLSFFGDTSRTNGISDTNVNSILENGNGQIWLGLRQKGIDILNPQQGRVNHLAINANNPQNSLPAGAIESLAKTESDKVIIGSNWGVYTHSESELNRLEFSRRTANAYSGIVEVIDDDIFAGGTDGLWKLDKHEKPSALAINLSREFEDIRTTAITPLSKNEYVVGTWQGPVWINSQGEKTHDITAQNNLLATSFISAILLDKQQRLWISTEGNGIFVGEPGLHPNHFTQMTKEQGLSSNVIRSMEFDEFGNIWSGGSLGIDAINSNTLAVQQLSSQDGVLFAPYYRQSLLKTSHGELLFGGRGGMTLIKPELWQVSSGFPKLVVTSASSGDFTSYAPKVGTVAKQPIVIEPNSNELTVNFSSLDFLASNIKYRYRLIGLNEQWHERAADNRVAVFTTLPPGDYQLEIQNSNRLEQWNPDLHVMHVKVLPFWYQTIAAKIGGIILLALFVYCFVRYRTARLQKRQDYLESEVQKRTLSLQQLTDELATMSMTDPLTDLKNRRYLEQAMQVEAANVLEKYSDEQRTDKRVDGGDVVFILIDVDHFKRVNDKYGHQSGDAVLIEITKRIRLIARDSDHLVRWGGEEFLLIVKESSSERAESIAERLRQKIKQTSIKIEGDIEINMTCSIGLCGYPFFARKPENLSWSECINLADKALYCAKNSGRDTWVSVKENELILGDEIADSLEKLNQSQICLESSASISYVESQWKF